MPEALFCDSFVFAKKNPGHLFYLSHSNRKIRCLNQNKKIILITVRIGHRKTVTLLFYFIIDIDFLRLRGLCTQKILA